MGFSSPSQVLSPQKNLNVSLVNDFQGWVGGGKMSSPTEEKNMSKRLGPQPLSMEKLALPLFLSCSFSLLINSTWLTSPLPVFPNSLTFPMSAKFLLLNHNIPYSQCFQRLIISFLNYKTFKDTPLKKTESLLIKTHLFAWHLMSSMKWSPLSNFISYCFVS